MSETMTERTFDPAAEEARLTERCTALLERAAARGADEAEVIAMRTEMIAVRFEKGDLKVTQVDEGTSLGLRVFDARKIGFVSTNQSDDAALDTAATDALTLAGFSLPDDANVLPAARPLDDRPSLVSEDVARLTVEEAVAHGNDFVTAALAVDPRLSIDQCSFVVSRTSAAVCSTTGVSAAESDATIGLQLFGMAIDGDDVGGFDYWGDTLRDTTGIDAAIRDVVERFSTAALGNLGAGAAEDYHGPVLFAPQAFLEVFVSPLVSAASSIAVQRGRSALAGKLGTVVASPSISILDDPSDARLAGAARFDREGQPARPFPIVMGGVLDGYLYNAYSARIEGRDSTGHAAGGARSVPGLGPHALSVAPGDGGSVAELYAALERGLVVQRFSGTVDPASGDFSGVAKSARWVEGGKLVRPCRETLFSGNAFELLKSVRALSSTAENIMGGAFAPWALIDGLSVTAG